MIEKKLMNIQQELKVNKGQYNSFGGYKYRSCEDILEAVKPLLAKNGVVLTLSDELVQVGERYYIKATATLTDLEKGEKLKTTIDEVTTEYYEKNSISNTAYARESETKKGMDESQITGTASSYARKYALNGLFAIDDTKDADTDEYQKQTSVEKITKTQAEALRQSIENNMLDVAGKDKEVLQKYGYEKIEDIKMKDFKAIVDDLKREV